MIVFFSLNTYTAPTQVKLSIFSVKTICKILTLTPDLLLGRRELLLWVEAHPFHDGLHRKHFIDGPRQFRLLKRMVQRQNVEEQNVGQQNVKQQNVEQQNFEQQNVKIVAFNRPIQI
jgi:hypothetical protein